MPARIGNHVRDYKIVWGDSLVQLEQRVLEHMKMGFYCVEGLVIQTMYGSKGGGRYLQTMQLLKKVHTDEEDTDG